MYVADGGVVDRVAEFVGIDEENDSIDDVTASGVGHFMHELVVSVFLENSNNSPGSLYSQRPTNASTHCSAHHY